MRIVLNKSIKLFIFLILSSITLFKYKFNFLILLLKIKLSNLRCAIPTNWTSSSFSISFITNLYCLKIPSVACKISVLIVL